MIIAVIAGALICANMANHSPRKENAKAAAASDVGKAANKAGDTAGKTADKAAPQN